MTGIQEATTEQMGGIDCILLIDHSGSMAEPSLRLKGRTKMDELQEDAIAVARECEKYDKDGITVIPFSTSFSVTDGVTAQRVQQVFQENAPRGGTNLAEALEAAVKKARESRKQAVILVYTDGSPSDPDAAMRQIEMAGKELGRPKIGFTFIQVGDDQGAKEFLNRLDTQMKVDVCATVSAKDAETLTVPQLVWLAQNK
jgi:Mg-chelatase subunit ChlD